jgi:hypothetical protein
MADCEFIARCVFFNDRMDKMPSITERLKVKYCKGDNSGCARYMVVTTLGREKVPSDLYPGQADRAKQIIAESKG